jgi:hypothetical protein
LLLAISIILNFIINRFIIYDELLIADLKDQIGIDRILEMIDFSNRYEWLNYLLLPIIYLFKFSIVTIWILCGTIIYGAPIRFRSIFKMVVLAEYVWLLPSILFILWFGLFETKYSLIDLEYYAPLSLLSLFDATSIEPWLLFPLKSLNLFEVIYILVLALGIKKIIKKDYDSALKFTLPVYGSALIVWILFITFLSINLGA